MPSFRPYFIPTDLRQAMVALMVIAFAVIALILLNSCISVVPSLPEPTRIISNSCINADSFNGVCVSSATPLLQHLPVIPYAPTPTPRHGESMIYIIQFNSKLNMAQRDLFLAELAEKLGRPVPIIYHYEVAYHGVAVELTAAEAVIVASMRQVNRVQVDTPRYAQPHIIEAE